MNKVLIVDDNPQSSHLALYFVNSLKLQAHIVNDGEEALYFLINESPSITILDLSMPKLNGLDTLVLADQILARIKSSHENEIMDIIFYTSTTYDELIFPMAKKFRIIGYISKDWTLDYQKRKFKQMLNQKRGD